MMTWLHVPENSMRGLRSMSKHDRAEQRGDVRRPENFVIPYDMAHPASPAPPLPPSNNDVHYAKADLRASMPQRPEMSTGPAHTRAVASGSAIFAAALLATLISSPFNCQP